MHVSKQTFVNINKYALVTAILVYFIGVFTPCKVLYPGLIFVFGAGFFCLFHQRYFYGRLKLAALVWLLPLAVTCLTSTLPLKEESSKLSNVFFVLTGSLCLLSFLLLMIGTTDEKPSVKPRLKIVSSRIVVQITVFMIWLWVTALVYIRGVDFYTTNRPDLLFWGIFHVFTAALLPFLIGRALCGWLCPNATMQDGLYKNMHFKRPISQLPKAIDEQSHTCAMNISGPYDKSAPCFPATLLLIWFIVFNVETIWDLTYEPWWPMFVYMFGLMICSLLLPWRKVCTLFCWLSGYRALAAQVSLWRLRFNRSNCKDCKICQAEKSCPFFIDIRNQDNEMPATCCLCFSCMESCLFEGVITFSRAKENMERLKQEG
jgi:hypothetical protein